jgi:Interferon-induced transmembrane protein
MTEPRPAHPVSPPTAGWTTEDPYAPYAGGPKARSGPLPYEPYAGGPGFDRSADRPSPGWALSVVGVLFSFLLGAIALWFSWQVGRRWNAGDAEGARKASRSARTFGLIAVVVGAVVTVALVATGHTDL